MLESAGFHLVSTEPLIGWPGALLIVRNRRRKGVVPSREARAKLTVRLCGRTTALLAAG